jgi:hypothetical protein
MPPSLGSRNKQETSNKQAATLKLEAVRSFEMSKDFYQTTWRYSQDDRTVRSQCYENLKSNITQNECTCFHPYTPISFQ